MSTLRKIEANRLNAQRSTGPRTIAGKAASSLNNLQHGLRARTVVLPEESQEEFDTLCRRIDERYQPEGIDEEHLCEQMVISWWKAARVGRMEQALFTSIRETDAKSTMFRQIPDESLPSKVIRLAAIIDRSRMTMKDLATLEARHERAYYKAEKELLKRQAERRAAAVELPELEPDPDPPAPDPPETIEPKPPAASRLPVPSIDPAAS